MSIESRGGRFKGDFYVWKTVLDGFTGLQNNQFAPVGGQTLVATETDGDTTADFAFLVRKMRATVTVNTYDAAFVVAFRRNAATPAGASISVTALTIGEFATGSLNIPVSLNDLFNFSYNATGAGASKTISGVLDLYCQRVVE